MLLFYSLYSCCIFCLQCFDPVGWVEEEHPACKKEWWVAGVSMCRFAYGPADATCTTRVSRYQKKHSPTHPTVVIKCPLSASSICKDPWHPPCSIHMIDSLFPLSLSKFSLVYLLAWHPPFHTPILHPVVVFFLHTLDVHIPVLL